MLKFNWKRDKDKFLILLLAGVILLILGFPQKAESLSVKEEQSQKQNLNVASVSADSAAQGADSYEKRMEKRLKEILEKVDGVGKVEVMLVLRSSEEKVLRVDTQSRSSMTEENEADGSVRKSQSLEESGETVITGSGEKAAPVVEKEIYPEIEGIVILAQGAGDVRVKAEISEAAEALFGVPAHKIKVLKRVE